LTEQHLFAPPSPSSPPAVHQRWPPPQPRLPAPCPRLPPRAALCSPPRPHITPSSSFVTLPHPRTHPHSSTHRTRPRQACWCLPTGTTWSRCAACASSTTTRAPGGKRPPAAPTCPPSTTCWCPSGRPLGRVSHTHAWLAPRSGFLLRVGCGFGSLHASQVEVADRSSAACRSTQNRASAASGGKHGYAAVPSQRGASPGRVGMRESPRLPPRPPVQALWMWMCMCRAGSRRCLPWHPACRSRHCLRAPGCTARSPRLRRVSGSAGPALARCTGFWLLMRPVRPYPCRVVLSSFPLVTLRRGRLWPVVLLLCKSTAWAALVFTPSTPNSPPLPSACPCSQGGEARRPGAGADAARRRAAGALRRLQLPRLLPPALPLLQAAHTPAGVGRRKGAAAANHPITRPCAAPSHSFGAPAQAPRRPCLSRAVQAAAGG
jgi:hypothetical protein